jgi:hypothetical protein
MLGLFVILAGVAAATARLPLPNVSRIHIVFSNHLDVGYNGISPQVRGRLPASPLRSAYSISPQVGFIANVVNRYVDVFFPLAIETADALRGTSDPYTWMTQSWLVSMYLDCPPGLGFICPNASAVSAFRDAVKRGDIWWHAYAFNDEAEGNPDASLFAFGTQLTHRLDDEFGLPRKRVMSQRDVPGLTRSVIPLLAAQGVRAISIGVNGDSAPPAQPTIFRWLHPGGAWVYGMVHPGGYGGIDQKDLAWVPGFDEGLMMAWKQDNQGPHTVAEAEAVYAHVRSQFPEAEVVCSTFDRFVSALEAADKGGRAKLHNVTEEMGDTWIYGYPSDPLKMMRLRAFSGARQQCLASGQCSLDDWRVFNSSRFLLKLAEHTWGLPGVAGERDTNYTNALFFSQLNETGLRNCAQSYEEQTLYVEHALEALGSHPLAALAAKALAEVEPRAPSLEGLEKAAPHQTTFSCASGDSVAFSPSGGVLLPLGHFGELAYHTYSAEDYDSWLPHNYSYSRSFDGGFGKPDLNASNAKSGAWPLQVSSLFYNTTTCRFVVHGSFEPYPTQMYGAPREAWVSVDVAPHAVNFVVTLIGKMATRMPEAAFFRFSARGDGRLWSMTKLGSAVSPFDVMLNGSHCQHGVDRVDSVQFGSSFSVDSPDAPVVSPSEWPFPCVSPLSRVDGMSFILFSNAYNTNFPLWFPYDRAASPQLETDLQFRFRVKPSL